jgi:tyrosyl-tRNA synthetase
MDNQERLNLIKRNLVEIITEEELLKLLKKNKNPSVYLGTAITGRPHIGYFMWVLKLSDFLRAGFKIKILLADLHGALDNCPWDVLEKRYNYYKKIIPLMFKSIGVDTKNLEFIKGSDFELKKEYVFDILKVSTFTTIHDCKKAASEVVKFGDNPKLSGLIYPIMQMLDEEYLKVDMQFGATDQRKIFMFARENHPKIGYKPRIEIMGPMIPGLFGKKMSASNEKSKIDLLDSPEIIRKKINSAECYAGNLDNGLISFLKYIIMVIKKDNKEKLIIKRDIKYGGDLIYEDYKKLEEDFLSKKIHPLDLKNTFSNEIIKMLEPIYKNKKELEKLSKEGWNL